MAFFSLTPRGKVLKKSHTLEKSRKKSKKSKKSIKKSRKLNKKSKKYASYAFYTSALPLDSHCSHAVCSTVNKARSSKRSIVFMIRNCAISVSQILCAWKLNLFQLLRPALREAGLKSCKSGREKVRVRAGKAQILTKSINTRFFL